jgi:hypothetical protein
MIVFLLRIGPRSLRWAKEIGYSGGRQPWSYSTQWYWFKFDLTSVYLYISQDVSYHGMALPDSAGRTDVQECIPIFSSPMLRDMSLVTQDMIHLRHRWAISLTSTMIHWLEDIQVRFTSTSSKAYMALVRYSKMKESHRMYRHCKHMCESWKVKTTWHPQNSSSIGARKIAQVKSVITFPTWFKSSSCLFRSRNCRSALCFRNFLHCTRAFPIGNSEFTGSYIGYNHIDSYIVLLRVRVLSNVTRLWIGWTSCYEWT